MLQRILAVVVVGLAGLLLWAVFVWQPAPPPTAREQLGIGGRPAGGDFTLQSARGPVSLHDFGGKVVLVYFGYTYCPDICPTALAFIAQALSALEPEQLERVGVIFISVDPERDSPGELQRYLGYFHPAIVGVTGTHEQLAEVAALYGAAYSKQDVDSAAGYLVDHSAFTYVVGPDGRLLESLPHGTSPARVAAVIRATL